MKVALFSLCVLLQSAAFAGQLPAPGHVPAETRLLQPLGPLPPQKELRLAIGLPLRAPQARSNLLAEIYNPASPNYRKYLTRREFLERFGPTDAAYQKVVAFARGNGLRLVGLHSDRMLVDVAGSVASVERAFSVRMLRYEHPSEQREFFAPDREPSVPDGVPVLDVSGLSDISPPRCLSHSEAIGGVTPRGGGSGTNGTFTAGDLRAAYLAGVNETGAVQSVGLAEFDGYYPQDVVNYEKQQGLSNALITPVSIDGYSGAPLSTNGNGEVSLDMEMVLAIAPGISNLVVYEAASDASPNDVLNAMADGRCQTLSLSWAWAGGPTATTDQIFQMMAAQGQSFFCASGDSGAYAPGAVDSTVDNNAPSDNPYITVVGGTALNTAGPGGAWEAETVWNNGGDGESSGGFSSYYSIPAWQGSVNMALNGGSVAFRNIPDVACVASNILVNYNNGATGRFGGTSCAAPIWAALAALANERAAARGLPTVGFVNPALYLIGQGGNYASVFHDVVLGNNTNELSPGNFFAEPGFDLCTGWGSPIGAGVIEALTLPPDALALLPTTGFDSAGLVGGSFAITSETLTISNSAMASQTWAVASLAPWLTVMPTGGVLTTRSETNLSVTLADGASGLPAGNYSTFVILTNLTTGNVQTRRYTLSVLGQLVQNGGFETGGFDGWTLSGNTSNTRVLLNDAYAHSGLYGAQLGPTGSLGYLSQALATIPGQRYAISLWYDMPAAGTPNEFKIEWEDETLFDEANLPQGGWVNLRFLETATHTGSVLQIGFRDDPAFIGLDDISVDPLTQPTLFAPEQTSNGFQVNCSVVSGATYQAQESIGSAVGPWQNFGASFVASNSVATLTDTNVGSENKFYRVLLLP